MSEQIESIDPFDPKRVQAAFDRVVTNVLGRDELVDDIDLVNQFIARHEMAPQFDRQSHPA